MLMTGFVSLAISSPTTDHSTAQSHSTLLRFHLIKPICSPSFMS